MPAVLTVEQEATVEVGSFEDRFDNVADVEGVTWESSDPTVLVVEANVEDATLATARTTGKVGTVVLTARVDVDLGEGVEELLISDTVEVIAGKAVEGSLSFSDVRAREIL